MDWLSDESGVELDEKICEAIPMNGALCATSLSEQRSQCFFYNWQRSSFM